MFFQLNRVNLVFIMNCIRLNSKTDIINGYYFSANKLFDCFTGNIELFIVTIKKKNINNFFLNVVITSRFE